MECRSLSKKQVSERRETAVEDHEVWEGGAGHRELGG